MTVWWDGVVARDGELDDSGPSGVRAVERFWRVDGSEWRAVVRFARAVPVGQPRGDVVRLVFAHEGHIAHLVQTFRQVGTGAAMT